MALSILILHCIWMVSSHAVSSQSRQLLENDYNDWIQLSGDRHFHFNTWHSVGFDGDDTIYLLGGLQNPNQVISYDIGSDSFAVLGDILTFAVGTFVGMSPAVSYTQIGSIVYMITDAQSISTFDMNTHNSVASAIAIPTPVYGVPCLVSVYNHLIVVGGNVLTPQIYDLSTAVWLSNVPSLNMMRLWPACAVNKDKVYIIGGWQEEQTASQTDTVETLFIGDLNNIQIESWFLLSDTLSQTMGGNRALTYGDDIVVIGGGDLDFHSLDDINVIRPSGTIGSGGSFPVIISQYGLITTDDGAFIFGGFETYEENFYWYFDFTSTTTPSPTSAGTGGTITTTIGPGAGAGPLAVGCEAQGKIKHINWDDLANEQSLIPKHSYDVEFNLQTYELSINVDLEYLGYATDNLLLNGEYSLGITYSIGFDSFDSSQNAINEPSGCSNRLRSSFDGIHDFKEFWSYSAYPYLPGHIGSSSQYHAYPEPSEFWTLSIKDNACTPIHYKGLFSWSQLTNCKDAKGRKLIHVDDNGMEITLSGVFYVNIVSPFRMTLHDTNFYRVYPLIQQDFEMSITKQINVLSSIGTELFIISILSIFENNMDGSFRMLIFTQSADYIKLSHGMILQTPFEHATIKQITESNTCIASSRYTCGQLFEVTVHASEFTSCPPADFRGIYEFGFKVNCAGRTAEAVCQAFIEENGGDTIALSVESNFVDRTCNPLLYQSVLYGSSKFYDDAQFRMRHNEKEPYVIGQDTIYVETTIQFPDDGTGDNLDIFKIDLVNILVCTAPQDMESELEMHLDQQSGTGGCFSSYVDTDGLFSIISNGVGNPLYDGAIHHETQSNVVRFSFKTFNTGRKKIFIHIQTMLELQNGQRMQRRVLLSSDNSEQGTNQIRHFVTETEVESNPLIADTSNAEQTQSSSAAIHSLSFYVFLIIIINIIISIV